MLRGRRGAAPAGHPAYSPTTFVFVFVRPRLRDIRLAYEVLA